MKNSYKFIGLGLIAAGLFGASLNALAAASPASFLPDSAIYLQLNTAKPHPFQGKLESLFDSAMTSSDAHPLAAKLFGATLDNTVIGFSQTFHLTTGKDLFLVGFAMDASAFQTIIKSSDASTLTTENLGLGRVIYTADDNFFFTYKDGNVIASNNKDLIHDQLFTSNSNNLAKNTDYQNFLSKINPDSFLQAYIDFDKIPANAEGPQINSWLTSEAFAINQDVSGLSGKFYVNFKSAAGWNTSKYLFTPALFSRVNPTNLIFYQESNNLTGHLQDVQTMFNQMGSGMGDTSVFQEIFDNISSTTGVDVTTDLAPLFQNRYAIMIHATTDGTFPAVSLMAEVKGQEVNAQAVLNKFQTALEKTLKDQDQTYTINNVTLGGSTLKQISITYPGSAFDESGDPVTPTTTILNINYGVTADGVLVVTTFKNPADLISTTGLTNDAAWKSAYNGQQLIDVSLFNFTNLQTYLDKVMAGASWMADLDKILSPLHYLTTYTSGTGNTLWVNFALNMDLSQLNNYPAAFTDITNGLGFNPDTVTDQYANNAATPFTDVQDQDWFKPYVNSVYNADIMQGFDTEFRPNQDITRAEFVKTLISAYQYEGHDLKEAKFSTNFSDVDGSAWYSSYINQARANDFVGGYSDGSFHPNAPITRAEAMQMLVNSDPENFNSDMDITTQGNRPFTDVNTSDWFFAAVYKVFDAGYVSGKNSFTFSPNTNLTRAEAAKIISIKFGLN